MMQLAHVPDSLPPQARILQMLNGHWAVQLMSDVTRLGVPDALRAHGPMTAGEMASRGSVRAHSEALHRAMRACAGVGLFTEDASGRFDLTPLSMPLAADEPGSLKKLVELHGGLFGRIWTGLGECLRTGEPQVRAMLGAELFEYLGAHPGAMEEFGGAMQSYTSLLHRGLIERYDFSGITTLVDVGGGFGHLTVALLGRYPELRGVVFDRAEVIDAAPRHVRVTDAHVASRLQYVAGDMFRDVPAADGYLLKMIAHDWDDERAVAILTTCRGRLHPGGRVLCVEAILPELGDASDVSNKLLDVHMMLTIGGRERTRREWMALYDAAGLEMAGTVEVPGVPGTFVIEGRMRR